jgi:hypothetical protein
MAATLTSVAVNVSVLAHDVLDGRSWPATAPGTLLDCHFRHEVFPKAPGDFLFLLLQRLIP